MSKTIGAVFEYPLLAAAQIESAASESFALNGLSVVASLLKLLQGFLPQVETIDVSLDQMQPGSDSLREMVQAKDP